MNESNRELLAKARLQAKRTEDGEFNEEDLLRILQSLVIINIAAEKRRIAKAIMDSETKHGVTEDTGQLTFEGMESYAYEPNRLIRDNEGHVIEQARALYRHKIAESQRSAKHVMEAAEWDRRKRHETELFGKWVVEQYQRGRRKGLTFGTFVHETEVLQEYAEAAAS